MSRRCPRCLRSFYPPRDVAGLSVPSIVRRVDKRKILALITSLSGIYSRDDTTVGGAMASYVVHANAKRSAHGNPAAAVSFFNHDCPGRHCIRGTVQQSVIARLRGVDTTRVVIVGAHLDSTNADVDGGAAPGANDNASGTAALLEVFRILCAAYIIPPIDVEFHWYAAEERGLLGSKAVAAAYADAPRRRVVAMVMLDQLAHPTRERVVGVDMTPGLSSPSLALSVARSARKMGGMALGFTLPTGTDSDHRSWSDIGVPTTLLSEGNPLDEDAAKGIHTALDTISNRHFSIDHVAFATRVVLQWILLGVPEVT